MFTCKTCREKDARITDLKSQIEHLDLAVAQRDAKITELIHSLVEQNKVILNTYTIGIHDSEPQKEEVHATEILDEFEVPNEWAELDNTTPIED